MEMNTSIRENWMPGNENTQKTYTVQFYTENIHTTVTADPAVVTEWINHTKCLQNPGLIVGLDTEWFWRRYYPSQPNRVATLQLCVRDRCLIFQLLYSNSPIPASLAEFLSPEYNNFTFVGVGVKTDLDQLQRDYGIGGGARYVDLAKHAAEVYGMRELGQKGLKDLSSFVLGKEVEKPRWVTMSHWDQQSLTPEQVKYACLDAYVSFEIGRVLGLGNYGNYGNFGNSGNYGYY